MKRSVILIDRLDPVTLPMLWMKGQDLHLLRVQFKVPGASSDFSGITYFINSFDYPNFLLFNSPTTQHQFL